MSINEAKREALIKQLTKLREMTTANGCTESEAKVAAEKAQTLMDTYGVTMDEIKSTAVQEDLCEQLGIDPDPSRKTMHEVLYCSGSVGEYTNTKVWRDGEKLVFFGLTSDVQIAKYLLGVFQTAMDYEFAKYWKTEREFSTRHGRTARKGFMLGMASRLRDRLRELIVARRRYEQELAPSDSRALIVVKECVVNAAFAKLGFKLRKGYVSGGYGDASSYLAGLSAGNNVIISDGGLNGRNAMALK